MMFDRVARVALDEPLRVRAMLGALGEELEANRRNVKRWRDSRTLDIRLRPPA